MISDGTVPMGDLGEEYRGLRDEIDSAMHRVLSSGQLVLGTEVEEFEAAFADYCGTQYAVGVGSGSAAIQLALLAAGVGEGDEVITVPNTDIATTAAISHAGADIVWVDIDARTFDLDWRQIESKVSPRTKAIIPVHIFGMPAAMDEILEIASRHELLVIEDGALAVGADYKGRKVGSIGDIGCFSLAPGKVFGAAGDAGIVVTDISEYAEKLAVLRNYGYARSMTVDDRDLIGHHTWVAEAEGLNERLDSLQAAILRAKLPTLEQRIESRRQAASLYDELLAELDVVTPPTDDTVRHVFMAYTILSDHRDALRNGLAARGVASRVYYSPPLHLQPAYRSFGLGPGSFPVTEETARRMLSLPVYPGITEHQVRTVVEAVEETLFFEVNV